MGRYRKILVAFDGSESGRNALKQAIKFARTEKSTLRVLSVVPSYEGYIELVGIKDIENALKGPVEKLMTEAKDIAESENAAIETSLEQGKAYEKIVETAEAENCDLIVMGRRGVSHIQRMLIGSVTSRVIGHTQKDVLVVPRDSSIGWENIVLATDGSEHSNAASNQAISFAKSYGGSLTAVSVVDLRDEFYAEVTQAADQMMAKAKSAVEEVRKKAGSEGIKTETIVREGAEYEMIVEIAEEKVADVVFMGGHGRTGLKKLLMGSVTEKVIGHSPYPVMVVKS